MFRPAVLIRRFGSLLLVLCLMASTRGAAAVTNNTAFEALQRLKGMNLEANPTLKAAVLRVTEGLRGTPQFVDLVRDFHLSGQEDGLLEVALTSEDPNPAAEAIRLILTAGQGEKIRKALADAEPRARETLIRALSNSGDAGAMPFLLEILTAPNETPSAHAATVQGLARTENGARELLRLAEENKLSEDSRITVTLALAQARWPEIRQRAAAALPLPASGDGAALPSIPELVSITGDAAAGARVFRNEHVACIRCHRVGDEGIDYGPALTEIGAKLGKQALYESILDPSAGISFGFEGWTIQTKDGDELFGIIASETPTELSLKQQTGVTLRLDPATIVQRERQRLSTMPAGMAQLMTRKELVDLVEYLVNLKGEGKP